jgi:hypothetical protein
MTPRTVCIQRTLLGLRGLHQFYVLTEATAFDTQAAASEGTER